MKKLMLRIRFSHSRVGPPSGVWKSRRAASTAASPREATKQASGQVVIKCAQKTLSDPNRVFLIILPRTCFHSNIALEMALKMTCHVAIPNTNDMQVIQ